MDIRKEIKLEEFISEALEFLKEKASQIKNVKLKRSNYGSLRCSYTTDFKAKVIKLCNFKGVSQYLCNWEFQKAFFFVEAKMELRRVGDHEENLFILNCNSIV